MKIKFSFLFLLLTSLYAHSQEKYVLGPNSMIYKGILKGKVTKQNWESNIYSNTVRDCYIYVPAQYRESQPAALMIFQDGHAYVDEDGEFRVPTVFDNLISQGKMPVTIGLFINPGHDKDQTLPENPFRASNRSIEYDELSGKYGRFLLEEMIPHLEKQYNISDDPKMRAICGLSSGGICAFSAAWFYPDQFHKVLSHIGSFADIRGGHNYPPMIRKSEKKDIKIFLQDGSNDLDNQFGNWWLANLQMEKALKYKGYEYKFVPGTGGHDFQHGGSILPESLIWLWSDVVLKRVESGVYPIREDKSKLVFFEGKTVQFDHLVFELNRLDQLKDSVLITHPDYEQIFILIEGEAEFSLKGEKKLLGPKCVAVLMPGEKGMLTPASEVISYYTMRYQATKDTPDNLSHNPEDSFTVDFEKLELKKHDRGGIRNYFNRSTSMCSYYEMHVTTLNPHIKSHEPHTHHAAEIVIMIEGESEMEIGNQICHARKGDVYYLASNVPHSIRNTGEKQCMYFAFQWDRN